MPRALNRPRRLRRSANYKTPSRPGWGFLFCSHSPGAHAECAGRMLILKDTTSTRGHSSPRVSAGRYSQCRLVKAALNRLVAFPAAPAAATRALAGCVAVTAEDRTVPTRFERHRRRLPAPRTDHRRTMRLRRRAIPATVTTLTVLLGHPAGLAAFRSRVTAFLEERLIGSGEGKVLPAIAASKLNIACHDNLVRWYDQLYHCFCIFFVIFGV